MNELPTIAAISTPLGESGVGVIRISGSKSLKILSSITKTERKKIIPRKMYLKLIWDKSKNRPIEQGIVAYYKSPRSYTGEDMAEISTHGSLVLLKYILEMLIKEGATLSPPGEFSKRAFLNGKIDLSQAEGIINLIKAKTTLSAGYAFEQVKGKLSEIVSNIRKELIDILARIEVDLDFEEDMGIVNKKKISIWLKAVLKKIEKLRDTYNEGKILKEGIKIIILGRPNVGKSTLLNSLLREERALVTHIPGTTRDTIEEALDINGIPVILIDTAGFQSTNDYIEKLGQKRAKEKIISSDLVFLICDARKGFTKEDEKILRVIEGKRYVRIFNKIDLVKSKNSLKKLKGVFISAKNEVGIDKIKKEVEKFIGDRVFERNDGIVLNVRHYECLLMAGKIITRILDIINKDSTTLDLCAIEIKDAIKSLGEISGEEVSEEIITKIFKEFCVGK